MFWEWSEASMAWFLQRPCQQTVARMSIRKTQAVAVLHILAEESGGLGTHRWSIKEQTEAQTLETASELYRKHLEALVNESRAIKILKKDD